jgi:hypothetical protein
LQLSTFPPQPDDFGCGRIPFSTKIETDEDVGIENNRDTLLTWGHGRVSPGEPCALAGRHRPLAFR